MTRSVCLLLSSVLLLAGSVLGDMYLQNPRGSNNRLNENTENRQNDNRMFDSQNNAKGGYCFGPPMTFVAGSILPIEWTAQHGCGGDHVTCTEIIQYMCTDEKSQDQLRDGTTTNTIPDNADNYNSQDGTGKYIYGLMESYTYYQDCKARERNKGLFTADQNVGGRAINTRQNPGGTRYGFECPEERDYYPYWGPSPWKDVAVLVQSLDLCEFYKNESQNVQDKYYCEKTPTGNQAVPSQKNSCEAGGGTWTKVAAWGIDPPDCQLASFSRDNHLGNTLGGETSNYTWIIPSNEPCIKTSSCRCALRIRYNITTNESTGLFGDFLDAASNAILKEDPDVTILDEDIKLTLALDTAQYGRTFEDRSFMFNITLRPADIPDDAKIYNLNVRGKRGNIVQTFPATEYDYVPNRLGVDEGDYIHFQWTGCDTNPNNNEGEGRVGTDRTNIVQIASLDNNIPMKAPINNTLFATDALTKRFAYIDQNLTNCNPESNNDQDENNCKKLNGAKTPYFDGGIIKMDRVGNYYYTNTRNNNFSNRTQKGQIVVNEKKKGASKSSIVAGVVIGTLVVTGAALGGLFFYGKKNPHSAVGRVVDRIPRIPVERYMPSRAKPATETRREPLLA